MTERRAFLAAMAKPLHATKERLEYPVRPPYGKNESAFQNECPSCESKACVASCDERIITIDDKGTAVLDFSQSGCTFCEACAEACDKEVLSTAHDYNAEQINAVFRISTEACIAHHKVICSACKEPCIDDAILFNGLFNPVIDDEKCTGCGFCMARCPVHAIGYMTYEIESQPQGVETDESV